MSGCGIDMVKSKVNSIMSNEFDFGKPKAKRLRIEMSDSILHNMSIISQKSLMDLPAATRYFDIIRELQSNCIHENTIWTDECWTFGHYSGYESQYCQSCGKRLKRRMTEDDGKW